MRHSPYQGDSKPAAKKSLGQNFLINSFYARRIAELLDAADDDCILEIGPGSGALSKFLRELPHRQLLLVEKDEYWAREQAKIAHSRQRVILMDAMTANWSLLAGSWKIAGNLPYNVASPLIWNIVSQCTALTRAVFMVQKEVGQRIAASPGNGNYGALSVWVQSFARAKLEFVVGPGNFRPQPKVDSAVISLLPLPQAQWPKNPAALKKLLSICFQNRRKQLGGIFRRHGLYELDNALLASGLSSRLRPEELDCATFQKLSEVLADI